MKIKDSIARHLAKYRRECERKRNEERRRVIREAFRLEVIKDTICITHNGVPVAATEEDTTASKLLEILDTMLYNAYIAAGVPLNED